MRYEIEIWKDPAWEPLIENDKVARFTTLESVGKQAKELSRNGNEIRVLQKLVKIISMDDLRWLLEQTAK